jgi:hypothetical protein
LLDLAKQCGISFNRLNNTDKKGFPLWTSLPGDQSFLLMKGLLQIENGESRLTMLYLIGPRVNKIKVHPEQTRIESYQIVFEKLQAAHLNESQFISQSLIDLMAIILYLRGVSTTISSNSELSTVLNRYTKRLINEKGKLVHFSWYLHVMHGHLVHQLERAGSLYEKNCSAQERVNGQHSHALSSVIQTSKSSLQILNRTLLLIYFDFFSPGSASQVKNYKLNRKPAIHTTNNKTRRTKTLNEEFAFKVKEKKKRIYFNI